MTESRWSIWAHHSLQVRKGTSDARCFGQVFIDREYRILNDLNHVKTIIDCGAYVGYSSAYFLSRWPECELLAIEPDPGNFGQCCENLKPYAHANILNGAVWSHGKGLISSESQYRDGAEWSKQFRECKEGEPANIGSIDLGAICQIYGLESISLLKMDVEGAEAAIFSAPDLSWIDKVDCLVIETHDDADCGKCSEIVHEAMTARGFAESFHGELTMYRNESLSSSF